MARAEGMRQQRAERICGDDAVGVGRVDRRLIGGEFAETLAPQMQIARTMGFAAGWSYTRV